MKEGLSYTSVCNPEQVWAECLGHFHWFYDTSKKESSIGSLFLNFAPYLPVFRILFWPIHFVPVPIATTSLVTEKETTSTEKTITHNYCQKRCSHTVILVRQHTKHWVEGNLQRGRPWNLTERKQNQIETGIQQAEAPVLGSLWPHRQKANTGLIC